ncbi:MAG TPA: DUF6159 family protein [Candidatus Thermoplasmatota archaeon]|nr:DUF6159 family protein [Candidatus Thermoplasmatota archaeon]
MGRFARSWHLCKASAHVVKQDRELLWMPVLSFVSTLIAIAAVAGVGYVGGLWPEVQDAEGNVKPLAFVLTFALYIALAFVTLFFNAAVVSGATERLKGGDPTVGSALRGAWSKVGRIFLWSIVVATVNVILQMLREASRRSRSPMLGSLLTSFAGMAWNLATYFMVPVLLFEAEGIGSSFRRSAGLFKKTWGETVIGEAGIGLVAGVATLVVVLLSAFVISLLAPAGIAGLVVGALLAVTAVALTVAYFAILQGVYKAALYQYATTGQAGGAFTPDDLGGAFHRRAA